MTTNTPTITPALGPHQDTDADAYDIINTYIAFGEQPSLLRNIVLKLAFLLYTGDWFPDKWPRWTHVYVIEYNVTTQNLVFYELDDTHGMRMSCVEVTKCTYRSDTGELEFKFDTFYGGQQVNRVPALDVTTLAAQDDVDVEDNWYKYYTPTKMTWWTALQHLRGPEHDRLMWTCSGLTQALLGWDGPRAFNRPRTPDQLYNYYTPPTVSNTLTYPD